MSLLTRFLQKFIRSGELIVTLPQGERRFGTPRAGHAPVHITLADNATGRRIALNPALGAGEAFMDGRLTIAGDDAMALLDLFGHNVRWDRDNPTRVALWRVQRWLSLFAQLNSTLRARRNVAHHYDLNDRLYDLFLDADRQYSCAYYTDPYHGLDHAQRDKLAHIAAKLRLEPHHHVLDIGCGWGGMALYLHRVAGVRVTGITLSAEQLKVARARAEAAGVGDAVHFEMMDYRAVTGSFDRIVSVGMFEHFGKPHYRRFFKTLYDRLTPDGIALLHTIARADGPGVTDPWTAKYIFPGGYAPALSEVLPAIESSWLWVTDIEVLRLHYGYTLREWYARCLARRQEIESIYDARFYRMWIFYLAAATGAFFHDGHMNAQIQLTRRRDAVPLTRDYMQEMEAKYRALA
ncbi:MAG: cyclopropane-fatty-acyl-phospholipid synthase family protein [Alphaproteobacteria bacterium]|nr:cyclopropane-fatty-acyl-phospholipid synthase family protein [Alphaproteobacteria bacterium]